MIRVLIADDHAVVREGVKRIVAAAGDMTVVGEAATGEELLAAVVNTPCDAVLMDLSMPGMNGLEALREIRQRKPGLPVLVLSMYAADQYAVRALMDGAAGYLHKGGPPDEIVAALRTVAAGRRHISPAVAEALAARVDPYADKPRHEQLSNREFQVLCQLARGQSVSSIARELGISVKTVSTFRTRVLEKLGLSQNADLVRYALKHGLVE
jgi:two-component system, NarL family, invasion response regulator UvrY